MLLVRNAKRVADAIRGTSKEMQHLIDRIIDGDKVEESEEMLRALMRTIVGRDGGDWDLDEEL